MIREPNGGTDSLKDVCVAIIAEFYDSLSESVRRRCMGTLLASEVEDIVQEAFSRLWQALIAGRLEELTIHNWKDEPHIQRTRTTLFGVANFIRLECYRRLEGREFVKDPTSVGAPAVACPVVLSEIRDAVEQCPPAQRDTFLLVHQGWGYADIAAHQGVELGTVRANYFRARIRLQESLKDYA